MRRFRGRRFRLRGPLREKPLYHNLRRAGDNLWALHAKPHGSPKRDHVYSDQVAYAGRTGAQIREKADT